MPIALRDDFGAQDLRLAVRRSKDVSQARRLLALAAIYDGASRTEAARIGGVTLQIVRDWAVKFNAGESGSSRRPVAVASKEAGENCDEDCAQDQVTNHNRRKSKRPGSDRAFLIVMRRMACSHRFQQVSSVA